MRVCYRFSTGVTEAGKLFDAFVAALILLNVAAVIAESEPSLGGKSGSSEGRFQPFFDGFEVLCIYTHGKRRLFVFLLFQACVVLYGRRPAFRYPVGSCLLFSVITYSIGGVLLWAFFGRV